MADKPKTGGPLHRLFLGCLLLFGAVLLLRWVFDLLASMWLGLLVVGIAALVIVAVWIWLRIKRSRW